MEMTENTNFKELLDPSWRKKLSAEFSTPYFVALEQFVNKARKDHPSNIFPEPSRVFSWSSSCPFDSVKVVIIGQDPYPHDCKGIPYANGLAFSVNTELDIVPFSLESIYQELEMEYPNFERPRKGDLSAWASQGVLLLNTVLTLEGGKVHSHKGHGWEQFTDAVIEAVNASKENVVYMLWGETAHTKTKCIDHEKNLVLCAAHPCSESLSTGEREFLGCNHFRRANEYLRTHNIPEIDWTKFAYF